MFKKILLITCWVLYSLVLIESTFAGDDYKQWMPIQTLNFNLDGTNGKEALKNTINNLDSILMLYYPRGADKIENYKIIKSKSGNGQGSTVEFKATVSILVTSITQKVVGVIDYWTADCAKETGNSSSFGYSLNMDLRGSEVHVTNNAITYNITFCAVESGSQLAVSATARIQKGIDYGRFAGPKMVAMFKEQTSPMMNALKKVYKKEQDKITSASSQQSE